MVSIDGEMSINNFFTTKEGEKFLNDKTLAFTSNIYTGPIFESLDESL